MPPVSRRMGEASLHVHACGACLFGSCPRPAVHTPAAEAEYEEDDNERFAESRTATAMPSAPEPGPSVQSGELSPALSTPKHPRRYCSVHQGPVGASTDPRPSAHADPASEYRTFAPKPAIIEQVRGGSWSWDDGEGPGGASSSGGPAMPEWNPRTGFMGAVAEGGSGAGSSGKEEGGQEVQASLLTPSAAALDGSADLPAVSKDQVRLRAVPPPLFLFSALPWAILKIYCRALLNSRPHRSCPLAWALAFG
jgi:hypothetical protein